MNFLFQNPDFADLINQAARQLKMPPDFVEKDYWVTYVLHRLVKEGVDDFVFKGGTSLSKGWNLIDRFSEDIDLLFVPSSISKDRQRTRLKKINSIVSSFEGLRFDSENSDSSGSYRADRFDYSRVTTSSTGLLLPYIKLEMGYRGGDSPQTRVPIQSYLGKLVEKTGAANFPDDVSAFEVPVLDPKRTFVEKLFAIHTAFTKGEIEKYVRHYYDVYKLLGMPEIRDFIATPEYIELKKHVAEVSKQFFKTVPPPDLGFGNSPAFKLTPELTKEINRALSNQRALYFSELPPAAEILERMRIIS